MMTNPFLERPDPVLSALEIGEKGKKKKKKKNSQHKKQCKCLSIESWDWIITLSMSLNHLWFSFRF